MFQAKTIATLLFVGTTIAAMPALGRTSAALPPCDTPPPGVCYGPRGWYNNCNYGAGCSCYCGPTGCGGFPGSYGSCKYLATPAT